MVLDPDKKYVSLKKPGRADTDSSPAIQVKKEYRSLKPAPREIRPMKPVSQVPQPMGRASQVFSGQNAIYTPTHFRLREPKPLNFTGKDEKFSYSAVREKVKQALKTAVLDKADFLPITWGFDRPRMVLNAPDLDTFRYYVEINDPDVLSARRPIIPMELALSGNTGGTCWGTL